MSTHLASKWVIKFTMVLCPFKRPVTSYLFGLIWTPPWPSRTLLWSLLLSLLALLSSLLLWELALFLWPLEWLPFSETWTNLNSSWLSKIIRLGQEGTREDIRNRESVYILLHQIVEKSQFLSMDLLESCFPYSLLRNSYHSVHRMVQPHAITAWISRLTTTNIYTPLFTFIVLFCILSCPVWLVYVFLATYQPSVSFDLF